ncbi:hypothetical protein PCANC_22616 [Puccinia coronata f. sp. avenae]|uniref:Uncharacterized protein n=1 Tax=Puccinia coronata f. sp. avenae TaxID=200324 RepID=A0A2N5S5N9_9BASI|nr:hypothetical protein PCANC_22616 [Puccinia coronata f. sp. avenae]
MTQYKVVLDHTSHSGSAGLFEVLAEHGMDENAWNFIKDMHEDNPAASGAGLVEVDSPYGDILANHLENENEATGDLAGAVELDFQAVPNNPSMPLLQNDAPNPARPNNPTQPDVPNNPTPSGHPTSVPPGDTTGPQVKPAEASLTATHIPQANPTARPTPVVALPSQRCGRTEEVKPDSTLATSVLVMMQKSQESMEKWMAEEQSKVATAQADERDATRKRDEQRDQEKKIKEEQLNFEREEAKRDRKARDDERREDCRDSLEWKKEEAHRYEVAQEKLAIKRQAQGSRGVKEGI